PACRTIRQYTCINLDLGQHAILARAVLPHLPFTNFFAHGKIDEVPRASFRPSRSYLVSPVSNRREVFIRAQNFADAFYGVGTEPILSYSAANLVSHAMESPRRGWKKQKTDEKYDHAGSPYLSRSIALTERGKYLLQDGFGDEDIGLTGSHATVEGTGKNCSLLNLVESLCVLPQYHCLVFIVDIFSLENLVDLMQRIFHRNLMRKVGCKHTRLRSNPFNHIG